MDVFIFVHYQRVDVVDQRLSKSREVLVLVVQLLLVVICRGESFPAERINKQRMLLEILLKRILFGDNSGILIVVIDVVVVVCGIVVVVGVGVVRDAHCRRDALVLAVLSIVKLLVAEVVECELTTAVAGVYGTPLTRAEAQHCPHCVSVLRRCHHLPQHLQEYHGAGTQRPLQPLRHESC